jgi:hypothetical protein
MENQKHIVGMTKSHLDLLGAKTRSLELDYLRILYFKARFPEKFFKGYLLVMNNKIANTIKKHWFRKYSMDSDSKDIIVESFENILKTEEYSELVQIISEQVKKNKLGNQTNSNSEDAIAAKSFILETKLKDYILSDNIGLNLESDKLFPCDINVNWDFQFKIITHSENKILQEHVNELILKTCSDFGIRNFHNYPLIEEIEINKTEGLYLPIPGMYGGFKFNMIEKNNEKLIQVCTWSRVLEGSEKEYEINNKGISKI